MACISRILRLTRLKVYPGLTRNLSSNSAITSQLPQVSLTNNPWIWQKNDKFELPLIKRIDFVLPNGLKYTPVIENPVENISVDLPTISNGEQPKEAARLIVIRRNKMKRHKLKKLRKRMKYEWAKRRQRRELRKEKEFQAILIQQCKDGEAFSAEKYIEDRLSKLQAVVALKLTTKNPKKQM